MLPRPLTDFARVGRLALCLGSTSIAGCASDASAVNGSTSAEPSGTDASAPASGSPVSHDAGPVLTHSDAAKPSGPDAAAPSASATDGGGSGCMLGQAGNFATDASLNLFGDITYFAKGQALPKGRYRATYEDGCMKFNTLFSWTVNSTASDGWWLVGADSSDKITLLPGTAPEVFYGGYEDFDACVEANRAVSPMEFDFAGGKLGIWLNDTPYEDNEAGTAGRNPKWSLTLLVEQCPPDLILL